MQDNSFDTAFIYIDEAGDFDFTSGGTEHFVMTCMVTKEPCSIAAGLLKVRYKTISDLKAITKRSEKYYSFHASNDLQYIRDEVFQILHRCRRNFQTFAVVLNKANLKSQHKVDSHVYASAFTQLIDIAFRHSSLVATSKAVVVVTDSIPVQKRKDTVRAQLKQCLKRWAAGHKKSYQLFHHQSANELNLQAVDYLSWALFRKWERGDMRSFDIVSESVVVEEVIEVAEV